MTHSFMSLGKLIVYAIKKLPGSLENVLNWRFSFYSSKGCIYHHMISEILFQIVRFSKTLFVCLSFYSLMRQCLPLLEYCGVMINSLMNLLKGT